MKICLGGERDFQHLHPSRQTSALSDCAGSTVYWSIIVSSPSYSLNLLCREVAIDVVVWSGKTLDFLPFLIPIKNIRA